MNHRKKYGNQQCWDIPTQLDVVASDRVLDAFRAVGDMLIHAVLDFSEPVDVSRMAKAARLALDAEPVLGCSFVQEGRRVFWQRSHNLEVMNHCPVQKSDDVEADSLSFLLEGMTTCQAPQVRLLLLRHVDGDRLLVKVNHVVADAGGVKEYVYLLAELYRRLQNEPAYRPVPNIKAKRDLSQVLYRFSWWAKLKVAWAGFLVQRQWLKPKKYWSLKLDGVQPHYVFYRIDPALFLRIKAYAQAQEATLNEVMLAVVIRCLKCVAKPPCGTPMKLQTTADLRRYLPHGRGEAITNLSGFSYLDFGCDLGKDVADTLKLVKQVMKHHKSHLIGLGDASMVEFLGRWLSFHRFTSFFNKTFKQRHASGFHINSMTNMGPMDVQKMDFGDDRVCHAFMTAPLIEPPNMLLGLSGFAQTLTLSCGYVQPTEKDDIQAVFTHIKATLEALP